MNINVCIQFKKYQIFNGKSSDIQNSEHLFSTNF